MARRPTWDDVPRSNDGTFSDRNSDSVMDCFCDPEILMVFITIVIIATVFIIDSVKKS